MNLTPAQAAGQLAVDPNKVIWCPASVTLPKARQQGCTRAYATVAELWDYLAFHQPATAGKIWIGRAYDETLNLWFDGGALTKIAKYPITFQGGWKGEGKGLDLKNPTVIDGVYFHVVNWQSRVTVRNITVKAVTAASGAIRALNIQTAGTIALDQVQVLENDMRGAVLENGGSVTVTNSKFDQNAGSGLEISTNGAVTLKVVRAHGNAGDGVLITNAPDASASPVTVTNGIFEGNLGYGLNIYGNGSVMLTTVTATHNSNDGARVNNTAGSGNVSLKGLNSFVGNGEKGLYVMGSNGSVLAERLVAHQNKGGTGVFIDNTGAPTSRGVTITGSGVFGGNFHNGLYIVSNGPITTNQLSASDNGRHGIELDTSLVTTSAAVTMKGANFVSGNGENGLSVISISSVVLNRVIAESNGQYGIIAQSDNNITLICSSAFGIPTGTGLFVSNVDRTDNLDVLTLRGFFAYGNLFNEDIHADSVVRTDCP
jgi:hypothetical protein